MEFYKEIFLDRYMHCNRDWSKEKGSVKDSLLANLNYAEKDLQKLEDDVRFFGD